MRKGKVSAQRQSSAIWPIEELKTSGSEKVAHWVEHRLG